MEKEPRERPCVEQLSNDASDDSEEQNARYVTTQTDASSVLIEEELTAAAERIVVLELKVKSLEQELGARKFRLCNIVNDDVKVVFYTGFASYGALEVFYR